MEDHDGGLEALAIVEIEDPLDSVDEDGRSARREATLGTTTDTSFEGYIREEGDIRLSIGQV